MKKEELLKYCRLYQGQASIEDNPFKKQDDEFKWQMWREEFVAVNQALKQKSVSDVEEYMKEHIRAAIDNWANVWCGGDASPWIKKYFSY